MPPSPNHHVSNWMLINNNTNTDDNNNYSDNNNNNINKSDSILVYHLLHEKDQQCQYSNVCA